MVVVLESFEVPRHLMRLLDYYFRYINRYIIYRTKDGPKKIVNTAGATKGSILGPDLWNTVYDDLLRQSIARRDEAGRIC